MRLLSALWLGVAIVLASSTPVLAQDDRGLVVVVSPPTVETTLGSTVDIEVAVTNHGTTTVDEFVVHVDITDPGLEGSVDPEDWTATLTLPGGSLGPGETLVQTWPLQPISGGRFTLYAVALTPGSAAVASSNAVEFHV
ncbi:MAG: hypothetical protein OEM97_11090, partial [Acidimicrobiia bacterium]|nr:hypothetical protein [Acidimicrobiia bacterium]